MRRAEDRRVSYCAQVNPTKAGNREPMLAMARRLSQWAPNIAVKVPATAAGLDVLEDCAAEGITCTLTIQLHGAADDRHRRSVSPGFAAG